MFIFISQGRRSEMAQNPNSDETRETNIVIETKTVTKLQIDNQVFPWFFDTHHFYTIEKEINLFPFFFHYGSASKFRTLVTDCTNKTTKCPHSPSFIDIDLT